MNILIIGVSGFVGRSLYDMLECLEQHQVSGCSRQKVANINWQLLDYSQNIESWQKQLRGINLVINTVGIYRQSKTQRFSNIHNIGPKRLFFACRKLNIKVIQISAIGAEQEYPVTEFLISKRAADQYLLQSDGENVVLYPGIILGEKGQTTRHLRLLASMYIIPLVYCRQLRLPLISINQLAEYIIDIIRLWPDKNITKVVIAKPETLKNVLYNIRKAMGFEICRDIIVSKKMITLLFYLFPTLSLGNFNKQSVDMLSAYSKLEYLPVSNETASESLLKNSTLFYYKNELKNKILLSINLIVLSVIWVVSGLSSIINIDQSRQLIALLGINNLSGDYIIYTAAMFDILLGLFLWYPRLRRWVIYIQISTMVVYSFIISIFIPMYWLHPFAPIIKNLAMIVQGLYLLNEKKE